MNFYGPHAELLTKIQGAKVLVVGDLIVDESWYVSRVEGQDGDSRLRVDRKEKTPGGAGLVAELLHHLGCQPTLLTYLGSSGVGCPHEAQWKLINGCGDNQRIVRTMFSRDKPLDRFDFPAEGYPYPGEVPDGFAKQFDRTVVVDYGKGFASDDILGAVASRCEVVAAHCGPSPRYTWAGFVIVNEKHARYNDSGCCLLVTRGSEGIEDDGHGHIWSPMTRYSGPLPTWGCGDMVTAVFAAAPTDTGVGDIASLANDAAYLRILKPFPTAIDVDYLSSKERTVFTSGAFDLCHPGHVKLLQFAADLANERHAHLVVAVNTHDSIVAYKGTEPSLPIQARKAFVKSILESRMGSENFEVVSLDKPTPVELAEEHKAQTIVKGGDWEGKSVPEAEGRELVLVPRDDAWASSRMREAVLHS